MNKFILALMAMGAVTAMTSCGGDEKPADTATEAVDKAKTDADKVKADADKAAADAAAKLKGDK